METVTKFRAFDGEEFLLAADCRAHERKHAHLLLVNCSEAQIMAALGGTDEELADAIERVGSRIAVARRAGGRHKRAPAAATKQAGSEAETQPTEDESHAGDDEAGEPDYDPETGEILEEHHA